DGRRQDRLRYLVPEKEAIPARLFRLIRQLGKHPCISIGSKIGDVDSIPHRSLLNRDSHCRLCVLLSAERSLCIVSCVRLCPRSSVQSLCFPLGHKVQSISKRRPSRFVILSASSGSLGGQRS